MNRYTPTQFRGIGRFNVWISAPAALLLSLSLLAPATAAGKKPAKDAQKAEQQASTISAKEQIEYLESLTADLKKCRSLYLVDMEVLQSKIESYTMMAQGDALMERRPFTAVDAVKAQEKAMKSADETAKYKTCKSDASAAFSDTSRKFIQGFRATAMQSKAKEALAQWMAALEATSTKNFDQEMSKFNTIANALKLDLTIN